MRPSSRSVRPFRASPRTFVATLAAGFAVAAGFGVVQTASGSVGPQPKRTVTTTAPKTSARVLVAAHPASLPTTSVPSTTAPVVTAPVVTAPAARTFAATGNAQLDALLPTLPAVLFAGGAHVHFGYNPIDCCHAGGYNPGPNDVWVSERALSSGARLAYVTVHELGHSVHLHSSRGAALTAAVAGAPVVRPGSEWDVSEKVADCVAWALYPAATAASGITYWSCPDPWRAQVRAALLP